MTIREQQEKGIFEWLRLATPVGVALILAYVNSINSHLNDIDNKLFKHLTNDELHTPRSIVVTKAEFALYQEFRQRQMDDLNRDTGYIKDLLEKALNVRRT